MVAKVDSCCHLLGDLPADERRLVMSHCHLYANVSAVYSGAKVLQAMESWTGPGTRIAGQGLE